MSRRYTEAEKQRALAYLEATGDVAYTSAETDIPERTLFRWSKELSPPPPQNAPPLPPPPPPPQTPPPPIIADDDLNELRELQRQMLKEAHFLANSLQEAVEDAPLNQRVAALAQLIDRIIKLSAQLPNKSKESVFRVEFVNPDGTIYKTASAPTDNRNE